MTLTDKHERPMASASRTRIEAGRWASVLARDKRADGKFYYSVATTGVYCRPSCGARRPSRANVRFHATCAEAEGAGFRPCKRCKPNDTLAAAAHAELITAACRLIETAEEAPSLRELALASGLSPSHFHRLFKAIAGVTPKAYAVAHRQKRARAALKTSPTVTDAMYAAGYGSSGRFYAGAGKMLGMKPAEFRAGGTKAVLTFAAAPCSLGAVLVAASDKGVAAILLGDDRGALERDLAEQFPKARLVRGGKSFVGVLARVVRLVEAPAKGHDLPLDVQGTAFQHRVWQALGEVPPGATATYAEIAARIGEPKAVRAVAGACAANRIAIAIPCHRVVRSNGSVSGYRWGTARKRALLDRERKS